MALLGMNVTHLCLKLIRYLRMIRFTCYFLLLPIFSCFMYINQLVSDKECVEHYLFEDPPTLWTCGSCTPSSTEHWQLSNFSETTYLSGRV